MRDRVLRVDRQLGAQLLLGFREPALRHQHHGEVVVDDWLAGVFCDGGLVFLARERGLARQVVGHAQVAVRERRVRRA